MYDSFLRPIEKLTASFVEGVADILANEENDLKRANAYSRVDLPQDLYAHSDVQTEWWYYTGHCETESGKRFGFELAFFKRRTDRDRFGILPLRFIANPMYAAHFAISEIGRGRFQYDHLRSFGKALDLPVRMSRDRYDLRVGDWTITEKDGSHILHASFSNGFEFDAALVPAKPAVLHGLEGHGVSARNEEEVSNHFSFTRMTATGTIKKKGRADKFSGIGWMDREFGTWEQKNWDWFSIQLDDETELMIYHLRSDDGETGEFSHGRFIDREGGSVYLSDSDFKLESCGTWTSPRTGTAYPSGWQLTIQKLDFDLTIEPLIEHQELDTRGTSLVVYWEGACNVSGTRDGKQVAGNSYVELVGYDRSHEAAGLSDFLFGHPIRRIKEIFG